MPPAAREHGQRLAGAIGRTPRLAPTSASSRMPPAQAALWKHPRGRRRPLRPARRRHPGLARLRGFGRASRATGWLPDRAARAARPSTGCRPSPTATTARAASICASASASATRAAAERYERFMSDAADLVVRHGGSLSGEHGDGRSRGPLLERQFSPQLSRAFAAFRRTWDPSGVLNPADHRRPARPSPTTSGPPLPTLLEVTPRAGLQRR